MTTRPNFRLFPLALALAALAGCATTPPMGNVIPKEGGLYQAISTGPTETAALESALHTAERTCRERGTRHVVLDHNTEYRGVGTEMTAQAIERVQRIILGTTGQRTPSISGEEDYRVSMQFRCEDPRR